MQNPRLSKAGWEKRYINMDVLWEARKELKPGESSLLHVHHGVEVFHVIQGSMIQVPGKEPTMMQTGMTSMNLRDVKHGAFKNVGEGTLKLLTVHIVDKDKPLYDYVQ